MPDLAMSTAGLLLVLGIIVSLCFCIIGLIGLGYWYRNMTKFQIDNLLRRNGINPGSRANDILDLEDNEEEDIVVVMEEEIPRRKDQVVQASASPATPCSDVRSRLACKQVTVQTVCNDMLETFREHLEDSRRQVNELSASMVQDELCGRVARIDKSSGNLVWDVRCDGRANLPNHQEFRQTPRTTHIFSNSQKLLPELTAETAATGRCYKISNGAVQGNPCALHGNVQQANHRDAKDDQIESLKYQLETSIKAVSDLTATVNKYEDARNKIKQSQHPPRAILVNQEVNHYGSPEDDEMARLKVQFENSIHAIRRMVEDGHQKPRSRSFRQPPSQSPQFRREIVKQKQREHRQLVRRLHLQHRREDIPSRWNTEDSRSYLHHLNSQFGELQSRLDLIKARRICAETLNPVQEKQPQAAISQDQSQCRSGCCVSCPEMKKMTCKEIEEELELDRVCRVIKKAFGREQTVDNTAAEETIESYESSKDKQSVSRYSRLQYP